MTPSQKKFWPPTWKAAAATRTKEVPVIIRVIINSVSHAICNAKNLALETTEVHNLKEVIVNRVEMISFSHGKSVGGATKQVS